MKRGKTRQTPAAVTLTRETFISLRSMTVSSLAGDREKMTGKERETKGFEIESRKLASAKCDRENHEE